MRCRYGFFSMWVPFTRDDMRHHRAGRPADEGMTQHTIEVSTIRADQESRPMQKASQSGYNEAFDAE